MMYFISGNIISKHGGLSTIQFKTYEPGTLSTSSVNYALDDVFFPKIAYSEYANVVSFIVKWSPARPAQFLHIFTPDHSK